MNNREYNAINVSHIPFFLQQQRRWEKALALYDYKFDIVSTWCWMMVQPAFGFGWRIVWIFCPFVRCWADGVVDAVAEHLEWYMNVRTNTWQPWKLCPCPPPSYMGRDARMRKYFINKIALNENGEKEKYFYVYTHKRENIAHGYGKFDTEICLEIVRRCLNDGQTYHIIKRNEWSLFVCFFIYFYVFLG